MKNTDVIPYGTKVSFKVPDAFNHEGEIRNFIVINSDNSLGLMYWGNECKCKDGWVKFPNISKGLLTYEQLITELKSQYPSEDVESVEFSLKINLVE